MARRQMGMRDNHKGKCLALAPEKDDGRPQGATRPYHDVAWDSADIVGAGDGLGGGAAPRGRPSSFFVDTITFISFVCSCGYPSSFPM
jgi:hypothetical protein